MTLSNNSVAVITGAASGIGRALAVRLAQEKIGGIAVCDVNESELIETAKIVKSLGVSVSTHIADVSKLEQVQKFAGEVAAKHNRVTHLINNAGVALCGSFEEISLADFEWLMNINFWGVIYGTKVFLPILKQQEKAHIINISSVFGLVAPPGQSAYCASKFAVRGFTESLRHELEDTNISVSTVHPGGIKTNIANNSRVGENADKNIKKKVVNFFDKASPTTAEQAADVIVSGIKRKNPRILIGSDARQINIIQRLFPVKYFSVMDKFSGGKLSAFMKTKIS
ncbi:MAG: SDR family NAD(P)-dependent oxidoreductase [Acidobacteriota bacterium]|nr:SDR family NAD(P)-dependent oxidoreductase [Acidobacteriota bacterium]